MLLVIKTATKVLNSKQRPQCFFHYFTFYPGTLVISGAIGVFFAWRDREKNSLEHYYFGGKKMPPVCLFAKNMLTTCYIFNC